MHLDMPARRRFDKLSVSMPGDVVARTRQVAFFNRLSESSIVEVALRAFLERGDEARIASSLRKHGAALRRRLAGRPVDPRKPKTRSDGPARPELGKMSMNVPVDLGARARRLAFDLRLSDSAIVETALRAFFAQSDDDRKIGELLRRHGASLRRT